MLGALISYPEPEYLKDCAFLPCRAHAPPLWPRSCGVTSSCFSRDSAFRDFHVVKRVSNGREYWNQQPPHDSYLPLSSSVAYLRRTNRLDSGEVPKAEMFNWAKNAHVRTASSHLVASG